MAIKRLTIDGYGQVELNNCAFRRDGRIEAQCKADTTDFASVPVENGMLVAIDNANRTIKFVTSNNKHLPVGLVYSAEHIYDERTPGLKNFKLNATDDFLPREGLLTVGDKWTSNLVSYDSAVDTAWTTESAVKTALAAYKTTPVYGKPATDGSIQVTATLPTDGMRLVVANGAATMPDGTFGVKFQVLAN